MTQFNYTAEKSDGEVYKGTAEAKDRFELYTVVRKEGGKIISVVEDTSGGVLSFAYWRLQFSHVSQYERILFARNLGAMLSAGLTLARALSVIERQTKNLRFAKIVAEIGSNVRRGDTLHEALAKFPAIFPQLFIAMVRAGEEGGDLSASLGALSEQMERMNDLKKKIRGAMIYPSIILTAILGIGIFMMIEVVPTLADTFSQMHATLPASTRFVIGLSGFLVQYTVFAIGGIILFVASIFASMRTAIGMRVRDYILLHVPAIGTLVRETNAARTARTLASLLTSGVDVLTALEISGEVVQNSFFREVIKTASEEVGAGAPLSGAFSRREDLYPSFVGEMMAVGEETGTTTEMLKRLAVYYENEVDQKTRDMSTIIEPFLMLIIGAGVGFFAVSMIAPIYQLSQNI